MIAVVHININFNYINITHNVDQKLIYVINENNISTQHLYN